MRRKTSNNSCEAFQYFVEDESFRAVDLAALRLAAVRKDDLLISSLLDFKNDDDVDALKANLLTVACKYDCGVCG